MLYTLTSDDEDKRVRVKVTFIDDENSHKLTSFTTGAVLQRRGIPAGKVGVSMDATTYVVSEDQRVQITITLAEAPEDEALFIPFTVTPASGTSQSDFSVSSSYTRQLRFDTKETTDQINIFAVDDRLDDEGESLTLCLGDLPEPYAVLVGLDCATINIIDNDDPNRVKVSFYSGNYYASEDGNPAWPRVTVHSVPDREITIPITFTRGGGLSAADHSTVTTSVTFGPDVRGGRLLTDNISYASLPIEIWALDDDGEYMDLAFGPMPDRFVSEETGYHLGGDKREGFRRPANQSRVWFQGNEFTVVPVTNPPNRLQVPRMVWASFLDAELENSEGNFENGRVATVRVRLSRHRDIARTVTIAITVTPHGGATPAWTTSRPTSPANSPSSPARRSSPSAWRRSTTTSTTST